MQSLRPKVGLITPSRTYVMEDDAAELNTERLAGCVTGLEDLGFTVVRDAAGFRNCAATAAQMRNVRQN